MDIPLDAQAKIDEAEARVKSLRHDKQFIGDFVARARHDELISSVGDYIRSLKNHYEPRAVDPKKVSSWTAESIESKKRRVDRVVQHAMKQSSEGSAKLTRWLAEKKEKECRIKPPK